MPSQVNDNGTDGDNNNQQNPLPVVEPNVALEDNLEINGVEPDGAVSRNVDVNIELANQEILAPDSDLDADAEEFRRRFYEAISRRNAQLVQSPPYDEMDEDEDDDDNINLIDDIIEDDDSFDGITTRQPSSNRKLMERLLRMPGVSWLRRKFLRSRREDRDSDENVREVSSVPVFDLQLPSRHSYLGEAMETLSGRTILEGGSITDIPLVLLDFHLVPGQTLPLTVFHAGTQSALRQCVPNNRHFGIVHSGLNDVNIRAPLPRRALGTTAEIYEFQEERQQEPGSHVPPSVNIKAKGRHRFNVLSTYRQSDGHLYAKVKIRPEISLLKQPWRNLMSSGHRHMFPVYPPKSAKLQSPTITPSHSTHSTLAERRDRLRRRSENSTSSSKANKFSTENDEMTKNNFHVSSTVSSSLESRENVTASKMAKVSEGNWKGGLRDPVRYYSAMTGWPYFVYEQFDENILVEKLHQKLQTELSSLTAASVVIPRDPTDLSFWLAQNLTMNDSLRLQMLKMDTPIERLRFANKLIDKVSRVIECNECQAKIANHSDIFSMSIEGPQGTYVNPHGYVHELITVMRIKGALYRGPPSTESSWFPGYSWTVLDCRLCHEHIGWKFTAEERLKPSKFWGLARRSVNFKYDFSLDNDCADLDAPQPSSNQDRSHSETEDQRRDSEGAQDSSASSNISLALI